MDGRRDLRSDERSHLPRSPADGRDRPSPAARLSGHRALGPHDHLDPRGKGDAMPGSRLTLRHFVPLIGFVVPTTANGSLKHEPSPTRMGRETAARQATRSSFPSPPDALVREYAGSFAYPWPLPSGILPSAP